MTVAGLGSSCGAPVFHPEEKDLVLLTLERPIPHEPVLFAQGVTDGQVKKHLARKLEVWGYPRVGSEGDLDRVETAHRVLIPQPGPTAMFEGRALETFAVRGNVDDGMSGGPVLLTSRSDSVCLGVVRLGGESAMAMVGIASDSILRFLDRVLERLSAPPLRVGLKTFLEFRLADADLVDLVRENRERDGVEGVTRLALRAVAREDPTERHFVYRILGILGGPDAFAAVELGLSDPNPFARLGAERAREFSWLEHEGD